MGFDDRLGWLLLGMVLGYVIRWIQEIRKEVHEVDLIVKKKEHDEGGFMRNRIAADVAMVLVFAMCLYATVSTGNTNNKLEDAVVDIRASQAEDEQIQLRLARITICTQEYLTKTIRALNGRTTFTVAQADANIKLQQAQSDFFQLLLSDPPKSEDERRAAAFAYVDRLNSFVEVGNKFKKSVKASPFPKSENFLSCLATKTQDEKDNPDESKD